MKSSAWSKAATTEGFAITLVADQLRQRVPGGIGVYILGLLQGFSGLCSESITGVSIGKSLRLTLFASKQDSEQDQLKDFIASRDKNLSGGGVSFSLVEKTANSRAFMTACRFGLLSVPQSDLVAATSLVVPKYRGVLSVALHDLAFRDTPESFTSHGRRWHEAALVRALKRAYGFSVPTADMALRVREMTDKPVAVIGYGCDHLPEPDVAGAEKILHRILGDTYDREHKLLLTVGTLEPRKNLARIIRAFSAVRDSYQGKVSLLVIGPQGWGEMPEVSEGVYLLGRVSEGELAAFYKIAYALVYAPILEGYGLPVVEAFYSALPVISSDVPSAGGATLSVDPLAEADIAAKIVDVLTTPSLRSDLIRRGAERLAGNRWRDIALQHLLFWRYLQVKYAYPAGHVEMLQKIGISQENAGEDGFKLFYEAKDLSAELRLFT